MKPIRPDAGWKDLVRALFSERLGPEQALEALGRLSPPEAERAAAAILQVLLSAKDESECSRACKALVRLGKAGFLALIEALATDGVHDLIGYMDHYPDFAVVQFYLANFTQAAVPLLENAFNHTNQRVRTRIPHVLTRLGRSWHPALIEGLRHTDKTVRLATLNEVLRIRNPAMPVDFALQLLDLLSDSDREVRTLAADALKAAPDLALMLNAREAIGRQPISPPRGRRKREDGEIDKSLLALLDCCLEWSEPTVSQRAIHRSEALRAARKNYGLPAEISLRAVGMHLAALARYCHVESLLETSGTRQLSRFRHGILDSLRAIKPIFEKRIREAGD